MHFAGGAARRTLAAFVAIAALAIAGIVGVGATESASAANPATFKPGNIIDDAIFYNPTTMSAGQVQDFLNSKVPNCASGYTCLKNYTTSTTSRPAVANKCDAYTGASSETAAQIIWNVSQICGINPQALIVLLQKEQGLVTSSAPSSTDYRSATGYGCPDTSACDANYYGFFNQLYSAALQFKSYRANPGNRNYQAGRTTAILYNPNPACGTANVSIANQATAGLYLYTPYTPNAAAMANLYRSGDSCSSYGNRNFWAYFTDWFGPTTADAAGPYGSLDLVATGLGTITISGWAIDPDTADAIQVHTYVDGVGAAVTIANAARPDVGAAYPAAGPNHGFSLQIAASPGTHAVCLYAINVGYGSRNTTLGCQNLTVLSASPSGSVASVTSVPGSGLQFTGWAADPETTSPIEVRVYVDGGTFLGSAIASAASTLVPSGLAASVGPAHGFSVALPALSGVHTYCLYAINVGRGDNSGIGCAPANYLTGSPTGSVDQVSAGLGMITVSGWALDYDTSSSIPVHLYLDGVGMATTASTPRDDIAAAFPGYGSAHGFSVALPASGGSHQICAYAINQGAGTNALLSCRNVVIPTGAPIGSLDATAGAASSVRLQGWALDYDTTGSIQVHIYVDGAWGGAYTASGQRPDIAASFSGYGSSHGFDITVPASPGAHNTCAWAIDSGGGNNTLLGCRTIAAE